MHEYYGIQTPPKVLLCIGIDDVGLTIALNNGYPIQEADLRRILNLGEVRQHGKFSSSVETEQLDSGISSQGRLSVSSADWSTPESQARKRHRPREPEEERPLTVSQKSSFEIQDTKAVREAYEKCFLNSHQAVCKLLAKAWVKVVEPKKQSTHPYTREDEGAPDWWPKPWGPSKKQKVRHKEPDHISRDERVRLLCHILALVVEPQSSQHPAIRKAGLNVEKLRDVSLEALNSFFLENDANKQKEKYIRNIFSIARQQERYYNKCIDGTTQVYRFKSEKEQDALVSDNEEETYDFSSSRSNQSPCPTTTTTEQATAAGLNTHPSILGSLPMRAQFEPPAMLDASNQSMPFVDVNNVAVHNPGPIGNGGAEPLGIPHTSRESERRQSAFTGYGHTNGGEMYAQSWQMNSSPQNSTAMYAYTASSPNLLSSPFDAADGTMGVNTHFIQTSYEESNRNAYGHSMNHMHRSSELPHMAVPRDRGQTTAAGATGPLEGNERVAYGTGAHPFVRAVDIVRSGRQPGQETSSRDFANQSFRYMEQ